MLGTLAALACTSQLACTAPPERLQTVVLRLGAAEFGRASASHAPMLAIGKTAREVIAMPPSTRVADLQGALWEGEVARMELELAHVPADATIEVEVQGVDDQAPIEPAKRALLAVGGRFVRLDRGWRLDPLEGGRARLTVERAAVLDAFPEEKQNRQVLVRVQARRPLPSRLTSRPFDVPRRATIELAYGTLGVPPGEAPPPVELRATLDCGGRTTPLLAATVAPGKEEARWRTHRAELPRSEVPCSLELAQADAAGKSSPFVVWGAARISIPADDDLQIVLISLDTLRADHVSGYGYPRRTTPEIDRRLIEQGVRFADASTTIGSTGIAHMSLFTGLFPREQRTPGRVKPRDPTPLLAERLQDAGFLTAAITEDGLVAGPFGFWFGFDSFREYHVISDARGTRVFDDAIAFVRAHRHERFFLFLHTYKVHDPWVFGPATYDRFADGADWRGGTLDARIPEHRRATVDAYDRTIVEADAMVAGFLDELERLGTRDRTLVILLSDHGEAFDEHGLFGHGNGFQQEQLHIPLIFSGPGVGQGVRRSPVGITDVASTVLDLAGVESPVTGSGRSLAPLVRAGRDVPEDRLEPRPLFFTWLHTQADGARLGRRKLIDDAGRCVEYDLDDDPLEERPREVRCEESELARGIAAYRRRSPRGRDARPAAPGEAVSIPPDVERSLRALGYLE